jgi:hypothetical protein
MSLLTRNLLTPAAILALASGCGGDETQATEDHTPVSDSLMVNDISVTAPYTFVAGQTVRVRIILFNAAQENLDDVESSHFAGLDFNPASLAAVARVPDHNYQFDVTAALTPGSGTLQVSFGHDDSADEVALPPEPVTISPSGGGNPP